MKKYIIPCVIIAMLVINNSPQIFAQKKPNNIIRKAMKDELSRNMEKLRLEDLEAPFFISYTIRDLYITEIRASLGSLTLSRNRHFRNHNTTVLVGDYSNNNKNFYDTGGTAQSTLLSADLPLEDDCRNIRRALWIATDNAYKKAAEVYERKKNALKQQTLPEETANLNDFNKSPGIKHTELLQIPKIDLASWENTAKEISAVFAEYPDIHASGIRIFFYQADEYYINSEHTELIRPLALAAVQISAVTQTEDGEKLTDQLLHYCRYPQDLPGVNTLKKEAKAFAEQFVSLRTAPVFDESYTGPVMFEGQAVAEIFAQRLFQIKNGLLAVRKPVVNNPRTQSILSRRFGDPLENRIGRRILSKDITIKAVPGLEKFHNTNLLGHYKIDAEGIRPPDETMLVKNGILKTLLSNRTPTKKIKESNGHQRSVIGRGWAASASLGPGVIEISTTKGKPEKSLKNELIRLVKEEGLPYGLSVRKIKSPFSETKLATRQNLSDAVYVYRIYADDGREELVRAAGFDGISISALRHIMYTSEDQTAYNTLVPDISDRFLSSSSYMRGIPASFITPKSVVFEELEFKKAESDYKPKLPCVESPLSR
ncbi:MAG: hypothetical protein GY795_23320 [Desulfobacterales bacterium]|nr:hypothetical protein [Desulfobacterales bacterium]